MRAAALALWVGSAACGGPAAAPPAEKAPAPATPASLAAQIEQLARERDHGQADARERFARLSKLHLDYTLLETPETANWRAFPGAANGWTDLSAAAQERRRRTALALRDAVHSIDGPWFSGDEGVDYRLLRLRADRGAALARFPEEELAANGSFGVHLAVPMLLAQMPMATAEDGERYLARLDAVPALLEQQQELLDRGAARGILPVRVVLRGVLAQLDGLLAAPPAESPLVTPLRKLPKSIPEAERRRLVAKAESLVENRVAPAFDRYHRYLSAEQLPRSRDGGALAELPDGLSWYVERARLETTSELTPQQIHEIGLAEVARLRARMEELKEKAGFSGSLADFFTFLQTDERFFYTRAEDLLADYRDLVRRAEAGLPALFGKLPGRPCRVEAVPAFAAGGAPPAYYERTAGIFFVNTSHLETRPKWAMQSLALHEGVPGHHLQLSLASALPNVPAWRKLDEYTAFFEGWALYAESLGEPLGFYRDPYSRFGETASQMWRAVRLVVDTGLHTKGWSREQAIDYFVDNVPLPRRSVEKEIDRYLATPAQALAYKVGELEIRRLRAEAESELGERFDLRAFHDRVLSRGAVPLDFLEQDLRVWIRQTGEAKP